MPYRITSALVVVLLLLLGPSALEAQPTQEKTDNAYKPLKLNLDESGNKYVRFIIWHQQWLQTNNLAVDDAKLQLNTLIRRSRFLAYAQISPRFLVLTHFGLNGLTASNLTSLGNNGDSPQLFLHGAWTEFKVSNDQSLFLGGGLHYWNGLTRLASQSTLNFMTMDAPRPFINWHSLAVTDQFARHLGIYAKGQVGKLDYRVAINNPGRNGISRNFGRGPLTYNGVSFNEGDDPETEAIEGDPTGNTIYTGYVRYNFWDGESTKLPYNVGSYLGAKRVLAIGTGFFVHPNGMYNNETNEHEGVSHFAADVFLDTPVGAGGNCLNAYLAFTNWNFGDDYVSRWAGTGSSFYGQVGFKPAGTNFMPYVSFQNNNFEGLDNNISALNAGVNYFINGHNAKLTLEYHGINNDIRESPATGGDVQQIRFQAHIFL